MAEEKTILTVDLYDNVLTEKTGDFTGKIRITGTTRTSDISNRIVKKRTEYRPETITNILDLSYDEMIEALAPRPLRGEQVRAMAAHYQRLVRREEIGLPLSGE